MVAKTRGPNILMVWKMKSWPTAEHAAISEMCLSISGDETMNEMT